LVLSGESTLPLSAVLVFGWIPAVASVALAVPLLVAWIPAAALALAVSVLPLSTVLVASLLAVSVASPVFLTVYHQS